MEAGFQIGIDGVILVGAKNHRGKAGDRWRSFVGRRRGARQGFSGSFNFPSCYGFVMKKEMKTAPTVTATTTWNDAVWFREWLKLAGERGV